MAQLDEKKLAALLDAEQWDEAGNLISRYLDSVELTPEERGRAYLQFAATYLGVMNNLSDAYEKNLDEAIAGLTALEKTEKEIGEKIDLARVKGDIQKMSSQRMDFLKKKCVPCEAGTLPFTPEQLAAYRTQFAQWESIEDKKIRKTFKLKDFRSAISFVDRIADVAESEGHHPDIEIHYQKVIITLWTHAIGGLSENDFILAAKIDALPLESATISFDDFEKVVVKMGKILAAEKVEGSDKLLKLSIDLGEGSPRTIVSGIAQFYPPEQMIGKEVPVVSNLAPRKLKGIESNGMVLFGIDETDGGHAPVMLNPDKELPPGSPVS